MLHLDAIRKSYGPHRAVDGLSLEVNRGELFGLLGPNGAGKSTTLAICMGLLEPDAGSARLAIEDAGGAPTDPRVRRRIGFAPQALAVYDELTAEENLRLFGRLYGVSRAGLSRRVGEVLEQIGLADRARSRAGTFSGGMKRRLNLGAALVHDPALILLDEPTAGVDPQSRNAIFEILLALRDRGTTIVYTTHYMEEAQRLCDRVAVIDHGRLLALGRVDELISRHGGESLVIAERAEGESRVVTADPVGAIASMLSAGDVRGVRVERPNLESVFLTLTGRSLRD